MQNDILKKIIEEYTIEKKKIQSNSNNQTLNNQEILYRTFLKHKYLISESNNIYVYLGTYKYSYEADVEHGPRDYKVSRNYKNADYSKYMDLETEDLIEIFINEREQFETSHKVIFPKNLFEQKEFYEMQKTYIEDCVKDGQTLAVEKILKRNR
ncbi:MAG: hypothetical protein NC181_02295 [Clostridium sp.]|nr:hypothetical protein [Clostridium sp.]MCM1443715.1 hypothetical protein [Candidatus Amulumruptor caecigallinarius]